MVSVRPVGQREPMTSSSKNQTNYYKPNENKFLIPPRYPYPEEQKPADKSTTKNIIIIPVTDDKLNKLVKKSKFNLKSGINIIYKSRLRFKIQFFLNFLSLKKK